MTNISQSKLHPVAAGTLFGGLVDCYVTSDGRRVVSQQGLLVALASKTSRNPHASDPAGAHLKNIEKSGGWGARETQETSSNSLSSDPSERDHRFTSLSRYLRRLPERFRHLAETHALPLIIPGSNGNIQAHVRDVEWVSDFLNAYVEAFFTGELHPAQHHLARTAHSLQRAASKVGWRSLVDEGTRYQEVRIPDDLRRYHERLLRFEAGEWQCTFTRSFALALDKLLRQCWDGCGAYPQYLAAPFGFVYDCLLGESTSKELRRINPNPRFGHNHHQHLHDGGRALLGTDLALAETLAHQSATYNEWRARMRAHFLNEPLQLGFGDRRPFRA